MRPWRTVDTKKLNRNPKKSVDTQRRPSPKIFTSLLLVCLLATNTKADKTVRFDLPFADVPTSVQNPGTGFAAWYPNYDTTFPSRIEYVSLPLKTVITGRGLYDFAEVEKRLTDIRGRGRQAVVRFYLDFPGTPSGIPDYLLSQGLETRTYTDHGNCQRCSRIPDYRDLRLQQCLIDFVRAYGQRFDGDPRLLTVQVGLIGFWGEWHTWPQVVTPFNFPPVAFQARLLQTYNESFKRTQIEVGINVASLPVYKSSMYRANVTAWRIGYSDDSLLSSPYSTYIGPILKQSGTEQTYLKASVGGEIFPPLQRCVFSDRACAGSLDQIRSMLQQWHVSWALNQRLFTAPLPSSVERARANTIAKAMGYRLHVPTFLVAFTSQYTLYNVTVQNRGIAPVYLRTGLVVVHRTHNVTMTKSVRLRPDETLYYIQTGRVLNESIAHNFTLYLVSSDVPSGQFIHFSNANINKKGGFRVTAE